MYFNQRPARPQSRFSNRPNRMNPAKERQISSEIIRSIRVAQQKNEGISAEIKPVHLTHNSFEEFNFSEQLKKNISNKKYTIPTPIQDQAIPHILEGRDIIGVANTGTGKTAAFLLPLIDKVLKDRTQKVLIIAPTRELALQIDDELYDFTRGLGIYAALCIGGTSMSRQRIEVRKNPNFIIGTPGRIKDLVRVRLINLFQFQSVVLDEADRMVDIGFIEDIKYFISLLAKTRQSLFFSATISKKENEILTAFVKDPITVSVKQGDTAANVTQEIITVQNRNNKIDQLHDLLIKKEFEKVLIFGKTKWGIQKLSDELVNRGFKAGAIHGNKNQSQRQRILDQFKRNDISILLATDVASRGLDINNVTHVINYEMPSSYEDYVHRIGRTGRANNKGIALTFVE